MVSAQLVLTKPIQVNSVIPVTTPVKLVLPLTTIAVLQVAKQPTLEHLMVPLIPAHAIPATLILGTPFLCVIRVQL